MSKSRAMKRTMRRKSARRKTMRQKTMRKKTMRRNNMRKTMRRKNMRKKTMRRKYKRGGGLGEATRIRKYLPNVIKYINDKPVNLNRNISIFSFFKDAAIALMNGDQAYVEFLKGLGMSDEDIFHILKLKKNHGEFKKDSPLKKLFKGATGYLSPKLKRAKEALDLRSNTSTSSSSLLDKKERTPSMEGTGELYTPPTVETDARAKEDLSKMKELSPQFMKMVNT